MHKREGRRGQIRQLRRVRGEVDGGRDAGDREDANRCSGQEMRTV